MAHNDSINQTRFDIEYPTTVLLVDDDVDMINEYADYYESYNIHCITANSVNDALKEISENAQIGVIISDVMMPEKNGLELLADVQQTYNNKRPLLTIFLTGHCDANIAIKALKLGAFDFLTKPLDPDHLLHTLQKAIELVIHKTNEKEFHIRLQQEVEKKTIELMKANRIKSEFLSLINHEIRTPINGIVGFTSLIQAYGETIEHDEHMELIDDIETSAKRLLSTMETIIDISDSISGNLSLNYCEVNLNDLIIEAKNWQRKKAEKKNINIRLENFDESVYVQGDSLRLIQSITYLLDNAIVYSRENSEISINIYSSSHQVKIAIIDNGIGMTDSEINSALQPFTQIDSGSTRSYDGVGLGLPLSRMLIELHNGFINIKSQPGKGTTITITLLKLLDID